jgi:hypothetical protein
MARPMTTEKLARSAYRVACEIQKHLPNDNAPEFTTPSLQRRDRRQSVALGRIARTMVDIQERVDGLTERLDEVVKRLDEPKDRTAAAVVALADALSAMEDRP